MSYSRDYCILLTSSAQNSLKQIQALQACNELITQNQTISLLFLQNDAVFLGNRFCVMPEEEQNLNLLWHEFIIKHNLNAHICVNSALRRGILDNQYAKIYQAGAANLLKGYKMSTLSILFQALETCDRFMQL